MSSSGAAVPPNNANSMHPPDKGRIAAMVQAPPSAAVDIRPFVLGYQQLPAAGSIAGNLAEEMAARFVRLPNGDVVIVFDNPKCSMKLTGIATRFHPMKSGKVLHGENVSSLSPSLLHMGPMDYVQVGAVVVEVGNFLLRGTSLKFIQFVRGAAKPEATFAFHEMRTPRTLKEALECMFNECTDVYCHNLCGSNGEETQRLATGQGTKRAGHWTKGWLNSEDAMRKSAEERLLPCILLQKVVHLPETQQKKKVSYAKIPVCLLTFDASTLRYMGRVTAGTIYNELRLFRHYGSGDVTLQRHAMLLFNAAPGGGGGYKAMSQQHLDPLLGAIDALADAVIDASGKELIRIMCTRDRDNARKFLSEYLRSMKLVNVMLTTRNAASSQEQQLSPQQFGSSCLQSLAPETVAEICMQAMRLQDAVRPEHDQALDGILELGYRRRPWADP